MPELQELMAYLHGRCPAAASAAMTMPPAARTTQADGVSSSGDLVSSIPLLAGSNEKVASLWQLGLMRG